MSVPPRPTQGPPSNWEVAGEQPSRSARQPRSDKAGLALVGVVLVALLVAVVLLFVL
jgi:hypothetical protein